MEEVAFAHEIVSKKVNPKTTQPFSGLHNIEAAFNTAIKTGFETVQDFVALE
jgi:hypothetical protein